MRQRIGLADVGDEERRVRFSAKLSEGFAKTGEVEMGDSDRPEGRGEVSQRAFESRGVIIEGVPESAPNEFAAVQSILNRTEYPVALAVVVMILVAGRIFGLQDFDHPRVG